MILPSVQITLDLTKCGHIRNEFFNQKKKTVMVLIASESTLMVAILLNMILPP